MRTFKTFANGAVLAAHTVFLIACDALETTTPEGPTPIPKAVRVEAGDTQIVVASPKGFCINRATIEENPRGAFMFLSDCRVVSKSGKAARIPISSILTASISPTGLVGRENGQKAALDALAGFFETQVGLFSLGKSHVDGAVSILASKQTDAALYLLVEDKAFADSAGVSNRYWRAFTEVNGRLVAFSVTGYTDVDPEEKRGLRIIRDFVQATLDANTAT